MSSIYNKKLQVMVSQSTGKRVEELALKIAPVWSEVKQRWEPNISGLLRQAVSEFIVNHANDPAVVNLAKTPDEQNN